MALRRELKDDVSPAASPLAERRKIRLVEETMQPGMSVSYVARRAGVAPSLLFNWRPRMLKGGLQAVQADEDVVGTSRVRELERRVRELERLLGRRPWKSRSPGSARRRAGRNRAATAIMERSAATVPLMKAVADMLAVAAFEPIERAGRRAKSRSRPYRKAGGDEPSAFIRLRVVERRTDGDRCIVAPRQPAAKGRRKSGQHGRACAADDVGEETDARTA